MTSQTKPSGPDSTGYWINLKLHALTSFGPYFTKIQDRTWFDDPRLQTNDFLIIDFVMKNQKNFDYVKPHYKLYTSVESSQRAYKLHMFQKLNLGNVQFRKSNFFFTILVGSKLSWFSVWSFISQCTSALASTYLFEMKIFYGAQNLFNSDDLYHSWKSKSNSKTSEQILHKSHTFRNSRPNCETA